MEFGAELRRISMKMVKQLLEMLFVRRFASSASGVAKPSGPAGGRDRRFSS